jgi:hypothetical protein
MEMKLNTEPTVETRTPVSFAGLNDLAREIHNANKEKGFWDDYNYYVDNALMTDSLYKTFNAQRIALVHSELSEALEADRKDLMDDHLPEYTGFDVELVDAMIRIFDMAGAFDIDLNTIMEKKLAYNAKRPFKHGKKY